MILLKNFRVGVKQERNIWKALIRNNAIKLFIPMLYYIVWCFYVFYLQTNPRKTRRNLINHHPIVVKDLKYTIDNLTIDNSSKGFKVHNGQFNNW